MRSIIDFEDFYNEMTKGNPLFFKDYYLTIYKEHIRLRSLKEYNRYLTFSCKINLNNKKEIKKYFEKLNFFSTCGWRDSDTLFISIESIKDILNNKLSDYEFSDIENNQLFFTNNKSNKEYYVLMSFSSKRFENYLTDKEKEKLSIQIKMLEIKKRKRITEKYKQNYEESKNKLEEMESNLTEEERLILTLRGII